MLGKGAFGEVSICTHRITGQQRACKSLFKNVAEEKGGNATDATHFEREIKVLAMVDHPYIIKTYEFFEDDESYYIVTE